MRDTKSFYFLIFCFLISATAVLSSCGNDPAKSKDVKQKTSLEGKTGEVKSEKFAYVLDEPLKCTLPHKLTEISGLTIDPISQVKYAVNDEKGIIYTLDSCVVTETFDFGKKGDYEGIELVNDTLYVLSSDGNIWQYDFNAKAVKINTLLRQKNDTEGLGYDREKNALLIACKGSPSLADHAKYKKSKTVYSYSLDLKKIDEEPMLIIYDSEIESYFDRFIKKGLTSKEAKGKLKRALEFAPSAIAHNPKDNNYYLLSTVGKTLVVVNENGDIEALEFLDHTLFTQPEGISFYINGDMVISNEGKGADATLLKFAYNQ